MSDFEDRQAARKARFEELAAKNAQRSQAAFEFSHRATEHIPLGQPILLGHHSEGRHRADLKRADAAIQFSIEAREKASYYARKADGVGKGGISSDDPEAIAKLRAELASLQDLQARMKQANQTIRKTKGDDAAKAQALVDIGWKLARAQQLLEKDFAGRIGFADYALKNNTANMRRIEKRIEELEATSTREDKEEIGAGYTYREDAGENRVMLLFDGKPGEEIRTLLKANGFKWSPTREAWIRGLNNAGIYHASVVRKVLDAQSDT
jgi:prefoldin subunit 5